MTLYANYLNKLVASNSIGGNFYGGSIAISGDGSTMAVAANYNSNELNSLSGAIRILTKSGNNWVQSAIVAGPSGSNDDYFDYSMSFSEDGKTLIVGVKYFPNDSLINAGRAWLYKYANGSWAFSESFVANDSAEYDYFGSRVALSADASVLVISAPSVNSLGGGIKDSGATYVYKKTENGNYQFKVKISAPLVGNPGSPQEDALFGASLSVSYNGSLIAIGAPGAGSSDSVTKGAAYVYKYDSSLDSWSLYSTLLPQNDSGDYFGYSIAISANGTKIVVGSSSTSEAYPSQSNTSALTVYEESSPGSGWSMAGKLMVPSSNQEYFGHSVSMTFAGDVIVAGVWEGTTNSHTETGAVYVFRQVLGSYDQNWNFDSNGSILSSGTNQLTSTYSVKKLTSPDADLAGYYGYSVATSLYTSSGNSFFAVGAPYGSSGIGATNVGAVYAYALSSELSALASDVQLTTPESVGLILYGAATGSNPNYEVYYVFKSAGTSLKNIKLNLSAESSMYLELFEADPSTYLPQGSSLGTSNTVTPISYRANESQLVQETFTFATEPTLLSGKYYVLRIQTAGQWTSSVFARNGYTDAFNVSQAFGMANYALESIITMRGADPSDAISPVSGKKITLSNSSMNSISVSWDKAYDDQTTPSNISYEVRYSTSNNISTVQDAEANGTIGAAYSQGTLSATIQNLSQGTVYFVNVIAKDGSGKKIAYTTASRSTLADTVKPVPGNSGIITSYAGYDNMSIFWTKATDNYSSQASLLYSIYRSSSNNIATVADMLANGTLVSGPTTYSTTDSIEYNLNLNTTYYYNVMVQDSSGNKAAYAPVQTATLQDSISPEAGDNGAITATPQSQSRINLTWMPASDNLTSLALKYAVYRSLSNNISTVAQIEANGTLISDYSNYTVNYFSNPPQYPTYSALGLSYNTRYYFNIIVKDASGNKSAYQTVSAKTLTDTVAPTPGTLTVTSTGLTSKSISWTAASDDLTSVANLKYAVFMSLSNDISTASDAEMNGTMLQDYINGTDPVEVTDLSLNTTYYFNVVVKDLAGNKAAYSFVSQGTLSDSTAPTVGGSGVISALPVSQTSIYLSWFAASDNYTTRSNLQYAVYISSSNNINTVANAETNGTLVSNYTSNQTYFTVNGLNYNTTYFFNVIVRDSNGNKSIYATASTTTLNDLSPPSVGYLSAYNATMSTVMLSWTAASDDFTPSNSITYAVYRSTANNIGTVANATSNGTLIRSFSTSRTPIQATGLNPSSTYYFTVVAKDDAGNKSIYNVASIATTADNIPPSLMGATSTVTNISYQSMTISFTSATDGVTPSNELQYALYKSISNNIDSVTNAEMNGVCARFYETDSSPIVAANLTSNTTYYFTVIVRDAAGNKSAYPTVSGKTLADLIAPTPGASGYISLSEVSTSRIDVSWTAATDAGSSAGDLQYAVYRSRTNNIGIASIAMANGTLVQNWTNGLTSISATGLAAATSYYFNVLVKDASGNISAYESRMASTRSDSVSPTVSPVGGVFASNVSWSSLTVSWTAAVDNLTPQNELLYRVYQSRLNNISTVAQIETNGTLLTSASNITSFNVTNLSQGTTYYYNVIVIDRFANKSCYAPVVAKTTINNIKPVPGAGGGINAVGSASGSIALSWTRAYDAYSQMINGSANDNRSLQYAVYSAPFTTLNGVRVFPSFRTVDEIESVGTKIMDYTTDALLCNVEGLQSVSAYYYNIIVKDAAGNKVPYLGVKAFTLADTTAPVPANSGLISLSSVTESSVTLTWVKAVDDYTQQSRLRYEVRYSKLNNIDTIFTFKNGAIATPYTTDINTCVVNGLSPNTVYYFNVIVMDAAGNRSVYTTATTTTAQDTIGPVPGNNGIVSFSQVSQDQLKISWTKATDTVTPIEDIEYAVYVSNNSNITRNLLTGEWSGTQVSEFDKDYNYAIVTDLSPSTRYWFAVVAKDKAGNQRSYTVNSIVTAVDSVPPTPGNFGAILSSSVSTSSAHLSWTKATDDYTPQNSLMYVLYMSLYNNITSVDQAITNGNVIASNADMSSYNLTGLNASSTYYFNVIVEDNSGNRAAYKPMSLTTIIDSSAPSAGNSGIISASMATSNSVLLSWSVGLDNVTSSNYLQYGVYKSISSNVNSVYNMEANGELVGDFMVGVTTLSVKGLNPSTNYWFNVMLKDSAGNKTPHQQVQVLTLEDTTPPTVGGDGLISFSSVTKDSMIVSWNHATDNNTFTSSIQYELRAAASVDGNVPNLGGVAYAEANGEIVKAYSSTNYGLVTGLDSNTLYYFNVIAKDSAGNKVVYTATSQRTANDLVEVPATGAEINTPVIIASNKDLIKNLPAVAGDPTLSKPSNWHKIHLIYKSDTTAKRVVVTITDFDQMSGQFLAKDAETFHIHKIIVEDEYGNFVSVPASSITNASNWSLSVI